MILLDVEQGSQAWVEARLGIPTASRFSSIVTPKGALSASRDAYLAELLAEWALGYPVQEWLGNEHTERGKVLEPDAFAYYGLVTEREPRACGFVYRDAARMVGCSPDFLVNDDGVGELKCPMAGTHLLWLARGICPREHWAQVQGALWVTRRPWADFMSYYPSLPPLLVRVEPDEAFQAALDKAIPVFIDELIEGRARLLEMGVEPAGGWADGA